VRAPGVERNDEDRVLSGARLGLARGGRRQLCVVDLGSDAIDAIDLGADRLRRRPLTLGQHDGERLPLRTLEIR
jgi:hypothetical protein